MAWRFGRFVDLADSLIDRYHFLFVCKTVKYRLLFVI